MPFRYIATEKLQQQASGQQIYEEQHNLQQQTPWQLQEHIVAGRKHPRTLCSLAFSSREPFSFTSSAPLSAAMHLRLQGTFESDAMRRQEAADFEGSFEGGDKQEMCREDSVLLNGLQTTAGVNPTWRVVRGRSN